MIKTLNMFKYVSNILLLIIIIIFIKIVIKLINIIIYI